MILAVVRFALLSEVLARLVTARRHALRNGVFFAFVPSSKHFLFPLAFLFSHVDVIYTFLCILSLSGGSSTRNHDDDQHGSAYGATWKTDQ
jgi:hypothetical protein